MVINDLLANSVAGTVDSAACWKVALSFFGNRICNQSVVRCHFLACPTEKDFLSHLDYSASRVPDIQLFLVDLV